VTSKLVKRFSIHPKFDCAIVKQSIDCNLTVSMHNTKYYYCCYIVATGKPDEFCKVLAAELYEGDIDVYAPGGVTYSNGVPSTVKSFAYIGFDTMHGGLIFERINKDGDPYDRVTVEAERMAREFISLAESYKYDIGTLKRSLKLIKDVDPL